APVVSLGASRGDADELGRPRHSVAHEHIHESVRIARDEARGYALERNVATVRRDRGEVADAVALDPSRGYADHLGDAGLPIVYEHIACAIRVAGHQVRRVAPKRDEPTVG